jgi:hypothetical protein
MYTHRYPSALRYSIPPDIGILFCAGNGVFNQSSAEHRVCTFACPLGGTVCLALTVHGARHCCTKPLAPRMRRDERETQKQQNTTKQHIHTTRHSLSEAIQIALRKHLCAQTLAEKHCEIYVWALLQMCWQLGSKYFALARGSECNASPTSMYQTGS